MKGRKTIFKPIDVFLDKLLLSKWLYIIIGSLFIVVFARIFAWGAIIEWKNPNYIVDNELLGTFGDFIGGVLGTIFSIISIMLVVKTFSHQRKVTEDNAKQLEIQRFNDLFFELSVCNGEKCNVKEEFEEYLNKNNLYPY